MGIRQGALEVHRTSPDPITLSKKTRFARDITRLLAGGLLVLALGLRLLALEDESLWYDEVVCVHAIDDPSLTAFLEHLRSHDPPMTPGYFALLYGWSRVVGRSVVALRVLSIIFSVTSLLLLYCFAHRLYGATAALTALAIAAMSNTHIFYAQEIRVYALVLVLATASTLAFHRLTQGGGARWWILNIGANGALLGVHLLAALLILAQGVFLLVFRGRKPKVWAGWAACHFPFVALLAWWMTTIDFQALSGAAHWIPDEGVVDLFRSLTWGTSYLPQPLYPPPYALPLTLLLPGVAAWFAWKHVTHSQGPGAKRRNLEQLAQLGLVIVVPPLALMALSFAGRPVLVMRYHLYSSYALCILMGAAVARCTRGRRILAVAAVVVVMAWHAASEERPFRPDWRNAATLLVDQKLPGDVIFKYPRWHELTFEYYDPELTLDIEGIFKRHELAARVADEVGRGQSVWIVCSTQGLDPAPETFDAELRARNLEFRKFVFAGGQPTFVAMALGRATLRQWFPTVVYYVVPRASVQPATPFTP